MPRSAFPKNYKLGKDNQNWLMRLKFKYFQVPLTGGPRVPKGFWKWRKIPNTLFLFAPKHGVIRTENTNGQKIDHYLHDPPDSRPTKGQYISRIQPWIRYHFALMRPLGIHWHVIWREKDVVKYPKYQSKFGWRKGMMGYLGWIRDSDRVYKPKAYWGGNFE